jgi:predicted SAM-dependent methyltransferase
MRSQQIKDIFHATMGELSVLNRLRLQTIFRSQLKSPREDGLLWVHLGCGVHYIPGMLNVDVNPFRKSDIWLDLRKGLPFGEKTVDAIYCCHTLEHFYEDDVRKILKDCKRVLKNGKGLRIVTPDLRKAVEAYLKGDSSRFFDFPDKRSSMGGKLVNYLLCRDQHRLIFDFSFWQEILESEGFGGVRECFPQQSIIFPSEEISKFEYESPKKHESVFVEAFKP